MVLASAAKVQPESSKIFAFAIEHLNKRLGFMIFIIRMMKSISFVKMMIVTLATSMNGKEMEIIN